MKDINKVKAAWNTRRSKIFRNRILSVILTLSICFGFLPGSSFTSEASNLWNENEAMSLWGGDPWSDGSLWNADDIGGGETSLKMKKIPYFTMKNIMKKRAICF